MSKYDSVARLKRYLRTLVRESSVCFVIKKDHFIAVLMSVFDMSNEISLLTLKNLTITSYLNFFNFRSLLQWKCSLILGNNTFPL